MKGKLILTDISSPVEGMQVAYKDAYGCWGIYTITKCKKIYRIEKKNTVGNLSSFKDCKQIVIEYDKPQKSGIVNPIYNDRDILPLHPDDWKWAIEHIGEEVEFSISPQCPHYNGKHIWKDCSCKSGFIEGAKLIHPTPVIYTRQDMIDFAQQMIDEDHVTADYWIDGWTNEHKKK